MEATQASDSQSSVAKARHRLTKAGSRILSDFMKHESAYPTRQEKMELLETVRALSGCEEFTYDKLNTWFSRHRTLPNGGTPGSLFDKRNSRDNPEQSISSYLASGSRIVTTSSRDILYPSLTPSSIQQLEVLLSELPEPNDQVVEVWAKRLKVVRDDVVTWIDLQKAKSSTPVASSSHTRFQEPEAPQRAPTPHLPTPSESVSPYVRQMSLPPIAVKEEPYVSPSVSHSMSPEVMRKRARRAAFTESNKLDGLPPFLRRTDRDPVTEAPAVVLNPTEPALLPGQTYNKQLIEDLRQSMQLPQTRVSAMGDPPRSSSDFDMKFKPYEAMMNSFIQRVQNGTLQHLGWDPNMVQT